MHDSSGRNDPGSVRGRSHAGSTRSSLWALGFILILSITIPPAINVAAATAGQMPAARVAVGDEAVDFSLESIEGETYRLADLRGEKNAIIIFFRGTW